MEMMMKGKRLCFYSSPSFDDIVVKLRSVLHWDDPIAEVKLIGRYDIGLEVKSRLRSMPITSQLHWDLYKQNVDPSQDKSLEIFAIKADAPPLQIDLNRNVFSPIHVVSAEVYVPISLANHQSKRTMLEPKYFEMILFLMFKKMLVVMLMMMLLLLKRILMRKMKRLLQSH